MDPPHTFSGSINQHEIKKKELEVRLTPNNRSSFFITPCYSMLYGKLNQEEDL